MNVFRVFRKFKESTKTLFIFWSTFFFSRNGELQDVMEAKKYIEFFGFFSRTHTRVRGFLCPGLWCHWRTHETRVHTYTQKPVRRYIYNDKTAITRNEKINVSLLSLSPECTFRVRVRYCSKLRSFLSIRRCHDRRTVFILITSKNWL